MRRPDVLTYAKEAKTTALLSSLTRVINTPPLGESQTAFARLIDLRGERSKSPAIYDVKQSISVNLPGLESTDEAMFYIAGKNNIPSTFGQTLLLSLALLASDIGIKLHDQSDLLVPRTRDLSELDLDIIVIPNEGGRRNYVVHDDKLYQQTYAYEEMGKTADDTSMNGTEEKLVLHYQRVDANEAYVVAQLAVRATQLQLEETRKAFSEPAKAS